MKKTSETLDAENSENYKLESFNFRNGELEALIKAVNKTQTWGDIVAISNPLHDGGKLKHLPEGEIYIAIHKRAYGTILGALLEIWRNRNH